MIYILLIGLIGIIGYGFVLMYYFNPNAGCKPSPPPRDCYSSDEEYIQVMKKWLE